MHSWVHMSLCKAKAERSTEAFGMGFQLKCPVTHRSHAGKLTDSSALSISKSITLFQMIFLKMLIWIIKSWEQVVGWYLGICCFRVLGKGFFLLLQKGLLWKGNAALITCCSSARVPIRLQLQGIEWTQQIWILKSLWQGFTPQVVKEAVPQDWWESLLTAYFHWSLFRLEKWS